MADIITDLQHEFSVPFTNPVLIFTILLLIVLLAPILLKRFNVPSIIGLIVAGVIIGPYGLNWIDNTHGGMEMFSTIGLLFIMFIVGLELDLGEFVHYRNKSLTFGLFTFFIPLVIGYPICHYLLGYDVNASFLTASMFSTHTLVAYPIVSRLGIAAIRPWQLLWEVPFSPIQPFCSFLQGAFRKRRRVGFELFTQNGGITHYILCDNICHHSTHCQMVFSKC